MENTEPKFGRLKCGAAKRFLVIKLEDFVKYVKSPFKFAMLQNDLQDIQEGRREYGRNPEPEYIVVNTDEPYFPEIKDILEKNGHWG